MNWYNKILIDKFYVGFITSIILPLLAFMIYWQISFSYMTFIAFKNHIINGGVYTQLMSLCVLPNLGLFFIFLQFNKYRFCYGVIGATIMYAVLNFVLKLT